jgi:hypothetical protein
VSAEGAAPGDRIADLRAKTIELATMLVRTAVSDLEVLLEDLRESDGGRPVSAAIIELAVERVRDGLLTHVELVAACRNIGFDLTCGQCASIFYTGVGVHPHDEACATVRASGSIVRRFRCPEHGLGVNADEDGCCVTCGRDCEVWQLVQPAECALVETAT